MTDQSTALTVEGIWALARERGPRILWVDDRGTRTWGEFGAMAQEMARGCKSAGVRPGEVVVIPGEERLESLAWGFGAASAGAVVAPLRRDRSGEAEGWGAYFEVAWRVRENRIARDGAGSLSGRAAELFAELRERGNPGLILSTAGTTGTPKLVLHDLAALFAVVPVKAGRNWRTLPLMRFDHIGGLDMAWRALAGGHILIEPPAVITPEGVAAAIEVHRVEVLPSTTTFLNL